MIRKWTCLLCGDWTIEIPEPDPVDLLFSHAEKLHSAEVEAIRSSSNPPLVFRELWKIYFKKYFEHT